jgi:hypothetical protein
MHRKTCGYGFLEQLFGCCCCGMRSSAIITSHFTHLDHISLRCILIVSIHLYLDPEISLLSWSSPTRIVSLFLFLLYLLFCCTYHPNIVRHDCPVVPENMINSMPIWEVSVVRFYCVMSFSLPVLFKEKLSAVIVLHFTQMLVLCSHAGRPLQLMYLFFIWI